MYAKLALSFATAALILAAGRLPRRVEPSGRRPRDVHGADRDVRPAW